MKIDRKVIEMWRRECGESPRLRHMIFPDEWDQLCDLALKGLEQPPEAAAGIPMTKEWIEEAKCGNCGGVGWRAIQVEAGVFEQDQCQWCFEQWQALEQSSEGKS
jgi:hypothetical protein